MPPVKEEAKNEPVNVFDEFGISQEVLDKLPVVPEEEVKPLDELTDLKTCEDPDNAEDKEFFISLKAEIEKEAGDTFSKFEPVLYRRQIDAKTGTDYQIMIKTDKRFMHVRISKPLPNSGEPVKIEIVPAAPDEKEEPINKYDEVE